MKASAKAKNKSKPATKPKQKRTVHVMPTFEELMAAMDSHYGTAPAEGPNSSLAETDSLEEEADVAIGGKPKKKPPQHNE